MLIVDERGGFFEDSRYFGGDFVGFYWGDGCG